MKTTLLLLCLAGPAAAHSWYDAACCSTTDCAPIPTRAVTAAQEGWVVMLQGSDHPQIDGPVVFTVPYGSRRERKSQDMNFHACLRRTGKPICLYVPPMGF